MDLLFLEKDSLKGKLLNSGDPEAFIILCRKFGCSRLDSPPLPSVHWRRLKKSFDTYRRLARSLLGMSSIWMGEDHLVVVKGSGFILPFTEYYRRFRYRDIQYLAVARTSRTWGVVLYLLGFLVFAGIVAGMVVAHQGGALGLAALVGLAICAGLAGFFLFLLLRHLFLGPCCVCDLKTNLRRERLGPLNRLHQANQAVELLSGLISEKQAQFQASHPSRIEGKAITVEEIRRAEARKISVSWLIPLAASVSAVFSLVLTALLHFSSMLLPFMAVFLFLAGWFLAIAAIVASVRVATPDSIRQGLFWLLGGFLSTMVVALVYFVQRAVQDPALTIGLGPFEAFREIKLYGGDVYYSFFMGAAVLFFMVSGVLLLLGRHWNRLIARYTLAERGPQP